MEGRASLESHQPPVIQKGIINRNIASKLKTTASTAFQACWHHRQRASHHPGERSVS